VSSSPQGTIIVRPDMRLAFACSCVCDLVGLKLEDAAGQSLLDFIVPEDREETIRVCQASAQPNASQLRLRRVDGIAVSATLQFDYKHDSTSVVAKISAT